MDIIRIKEKYKKVEWVNSTEDLENLLTYNVFPDVTLIENCDEIKKSRCGEIQATFKLQKNIKVKFSVRKDNRGRVVAIKKNILKKEIYGPNQITVKIDIGGFNVSEYNFVIDSMFWFHNKKKYLTVADENIFYIARCNNIPFEEFLKTGDSSKEVITLLDNLFYLQDANEDKDEFLSKFDLAMGGKNVLEALNKIPIKDYFYQGKESGSVALNFARQKFENYPNQGSIVPVFIIPIKRYVKQASNKVVSSLFVESLVIKVFSNTSYRVSFVSYRVDNNWSCCLSGTKGVISWSNKTFYNLISNGGSALNIGGADQLFSFEFYPDSYPMRLKKIELAREFGIFGLPRRLIFPLNNERYTKNLIFKNTQKKKVIQSFIDNNIQESKVAMIISYLIFKDANNLLEKMKDWFADDFNNISEDEIYMACLNDNFANEVYKVVSSGYPVDRYRDCIAVIDQYSQSKEKNVTQLYHELSQKKH